MRELLALPMRHDWPGCRGGDSVNDADNDFVKAPRKRPDSGTDHKLNSVLSPFWWRSNRVNGHWQGEKQ